MTSGHGNAAYLPGPPLTERDAEWRAHGICFKTGPPGQLGVELEWLVKDGRDPALPVDQQRVTAALARLDAPGALPGGGRLTIEPGGQVELSSAPAAGLAGCVSAAADDLAALRGALQPAGLLLDGQGMDPIRSPRRVLDASRYVAMEQFFDRGGPWGRIMMCSTASVQVCIDAGQEEPGPAGFRWRWRLVHALGPMLVAAFANSPLRVSRPTGWKSTRQAIWSRLDPTRTRAPAAAEPSIGSGTGNGWPEHADPRAAWVSYALDAEVMCVRQPGAPCWEVPAGLTFRDWLRGAGPRRPTADDLAYHLSTLFPPVRPHGHLELRMIDAQPDDDWIVPTAVVSALVEDPEAAQAAMAVATDMWQGHWPTERSGRNGAENLWQRAARVGPADARIAKASRRCFEEAEASLQRRGAPRSVRDAVSAFAERYVLRDRCPADDRLDDARAASRRPDHPYPDMSLEDQQ
jgi:ergothioneine biosynthesis glutamate--cysteine ligase EgtA